MSDGRVLIVDDDLQLSVLLDRQLKSFGDFDIDFASSLTEAQAKLAIWEFDIILLDLKLPNGHDPLETVREVYAACREADIILMIGDYPELGVKTIKVGAKDFLIKSEYTTEELEKSIHYALERKRYREKMNSVQRQFSNLCETVNQCERLVFKT